MSVNKSSRTSLALTIILSVLLVCSMGVTVALAYFDSTVSIGGVYNFHGGVALTIRSADSTANGVQLDSGATDGIWQRKVDNETTWGTSSSANTALTMSGLEAMVHDSAGAYARVFVAVKVTYTGTTAPTIPSITFTGSATSTYTTKESAFVNGLGDTTLGGTYTGTDTEGATFTLRYGASVVKINETADTYTDILGDYAIFDSSRGNEWQGAIVEAMVMITASTEDTTTGWNQADASASYTFTYS